MVIKLKKIVWTNLKSKTSLVLLAILFFLGNSFILENPSNTSSAHQIGGTAVANAIQPTTPVELDSIIYDYYSNGEIVNRGSSKDPLPRPTSTYSHPLSKNDTLVIAREEIAVIQEDPDWDSCFILDDAYNEFQMIHKISIENQSRGSGLIAGNIDEDPLDELLVVQVWNGPARARVRAYDDAKHNYTLLWSEELDVSGPAYEIIDRRIAIGNFDDDPSNEIVVFLMAWIGKKSGGYFYVIDLNEDPIDTVRKTVWENWVGDHDRVYGSTVGQADLAVGDFDQDGMDEFVIAVAFFESSDNCYVFDDALSNFVLIDQFGSWGSYVQVVVGDFDGDGVEEIAEGASNPFGSLNDPPLLLTAPSLAIWKYVGGSFEDTTLVLVTRQLHTMILTGGDLDGDGRDEIVVGTWSDFGGSEKRAYIYEYSDTTYFYEITKVWLDSVFYPNGDPYNFLDYGWSKYFTTGDIDGDGLDEILTSGPTTPTMALDDAKHGYAPMMVPNENFHGQVICGEFDGDGLILQYTGGSYIVEAPPAVVAVIAAPPCYAGIDQNYAASKTGWGTETTQGTAESTSVGTSVSTSLSFEMKCTAAFVSFGFSFSDSLRKEFVRTSTIEKTEAVSRSFNSGWTADAVIFHQTSYTSYLYEIIAHPVDESLIGAYITIDVPEAPVLHKVGLKEFNANYAGIDLGAETFKHTPGQPWTYPSQGAVPLITRSWLDSGDPMEVGQGSGFNFAQIQITETISKGFETTQASEFAVGCSIGTKIEFEYFGITVGGIETEISFEYSQGFSESKAYEVSAGESTYYEGSVGDIADWDVWNQTKYTYGLFIYYQSHPGGCLYLVVNYYVDGAIPYPPTTTTPPTTTPPTGTNTTTGQAGSFFLENLPWIVGGSAGAIGVGMVIAGVVMLTKSRRR